MNHPQTLQGKYAQHGSSQYLRFVDFKLGHAHAAVAEFTREPPKSALRIHRSCFPASRANEDTFVTDCRLLD
jgi:hypothetical protein